MISDGNLTTAGDLHSYLKDMFKDVLQEMPRDRNDEFEPIVIPKNKRDISGIKEAINAAYPKAEIQRCVIHQLRNSFKYVNCRKLIVDNLP